MATHSLDSFKAPTSNVQGQRGGNGCFVCRLRSKRCLGTENGASCPACCKLRVECVKKLGSISSLMENSVEGQACRDEIHSAVNSRRYRRDVALLPQTRAFAAKLATNLSFIHSDPSPATSPLEDDLKYVLDYDERSSLPPSDPSMVPFAPNRSSDSCSNRLDDMTSSHGSASSSFSPLSSFIPQGDTNDSSDYVLFPYTSSPKSTAILSEYRSEPNPIPNRPHPCTSSYTYGMPPTSKASPDAFIEGMRTLLRSYGYEVVPISR